MTDPITEPPPCEDHKEVQHRDGKGPWCNACGWHHGKTVVTQPWHHESQPQNWGR